MFHYWWHWLWSLDLTDGCQFFSIVKFFLHLELISILWGGTLYCANITFLTKFSPTGSSIHWYFWLPNDDFSFPLSFLLHLLTDTPSQIQILISSVYTGVLKFSVSSCVGSGKLYLTKNCLFYLRFKICWPGILKVPCIL